MSVDGGRQEESAKSRCIYDFKCGDFELVGYDPYPAIKALVAV